MYVKLTNGNVDIYPYNVGQLRRNNPHTSFPRRTPDEMLADYGVHPVHPVPAPNHDDRTQRVEQNAQPHLEQGQWFLGWEVVNKTAEEVQQYDDTVASSNRAARDSMLAATDYLALSDQTLTAEMSTYRQALRDITTHANWPHLENADWPVKP
jgi:hypothetical protein